MREKEEGRERKEGVREKEEGRERKGRSEGEGGRENRRMEYSSKPGLSTYLSFE